MSFKLKLSKATKKDILNWERESLGLFVSDHPLKGLGGYFSKFGMLIGDLELEEAEGKEKTDEEKVDAEINKSLGNKKSTEKNKKSVKIRGIVTETRKILTRNGKNMAIIHYYD